MWVARIQSLEKSRVFKLLMNLPWITALPRVLRTHIYQEYSFDGTEKLDGYQVPGTGNLRHGKTLLDLG